MKPSTAILALVTLLLSVFAIARHVNQPTDPEDALPSPHGRATWGWIGCRLSDVHEEVARELGLNAAEGVLIVEAIPDSPGAVGGLRDQDVVRKMDDHVIRTTEDLRGVVRTTKPGQLMMFTVTRGNETKVIPVTLGQRPAPERPPPPELPN
jgi:S1-C subfamily serine protease